MTIILSCNVLAVVNLSTIDRPANCQPKLCPLLDSCLQVQAASMQGGDTVNLQCWQRADVDD